MTKLIFIVLALFFTPMVTCDEKVDASTIQPQEMQQVIENIAVALELTYLHPDKLPNLRALLYSEQYTTEYEREQFRKDIRAALIRSTQDTGIDVTELLPSSHYSKGTINYEVSDRNIAYLQLTGELNLADSANSLSDALMHISETKSLIIDLRLVDQTELALVQQLLSYFVAETKVIAEVHQNTDVRYLYPLSRSYSTPIYESPIYVLTSSFVAAEWELFTHALQSLGKAEVVGEATMGIGQLSHTVKVGHDIVLTVPYAIIRQPGSEYSWDEQGLTPNHFTKGALALEKAYYLAMEQGTKSAL